MNLTALRYVTAAAIAVVLVVLLLVIGISLYRGVSEAQVVPLLSVVGTLVALLVGLFGTQAMSGQVADVQQKVNGHLDAHQVQSDQMQALVDQHLQQMQALVDQRLREHGLAPATTPLAGEAGATPPSAPPPTTAGEGLH